MSLPKVPLEYVYSETWKWRTEHVKNPAKSRHRGEQCRGPEMGRVCVCVCVCVCARVLSHFLLWRLGLWPTRLLCSWGFSRQEYWSGSSCPPPGDLPQPGIEPTSPASPAGAGRLLTTRPSGKPGWEGTWLFCRKHKPEANVVSMQ